MEHLLDDLLSSASNKVLQASIELANKGAQSVPMLIAALESQQEDKKRLIIAGVLANIGAESVEAVIDLLVRNESCRLICALILKDIGKNSVPYLIEGLANKNPDIRAISAEILGEINDSRSLEALKELDNDESEEVVIAAKEAVKQIERPFASKVIESLRYSSQIENMLKDIDEK